MLDIKVPDPIELFKDYFQKRGISDSVIDQNEISLRSFEYCAGLNPPLRQLKGRPGFAALIPYFDPEGNPIPYHTARILQLAQKATFAGQLGLEQAKLVCPMGMSYAYFPRNNPKRDKKTRCIVTESAIKAIVAAMCGFYAIGLNGCWGFRSKHTTDRMLPIFREINWRSFSDIMFVPDSNVEGNDDVRAAAARFCSDMAVMYKVEPRVIVIPKEEDGADRGLDDFYASNGRAATTELLGSEGVSAELSEYLEAMVEINSDVSYVKGVDLFAIHSSNLLVKEKHFHNLYATKTYTDHEERIKEASRAWIKWQNRNEVFAIVNHPGQPPVYEGNYNLWRPADIEATEGDVEVHEQFLRTALPDARERKWLQQWIGHVVQNQDQKLNTALVLFSPEQGTGKTMLAETISFILGEKNTARTSMDLVRSSFNSSYAGKQLVVINETLVGDSAGTFMDKMKVLITEHTIMYHAKGKDGFEMPNFANYILTTNHLNALKIDPTDRRFAVFEFRSQFRHSPVAEEWGRRCWLWHRHHLGELLWYYSQMDLEGFQPDAPALENEAKREMAEAGYNEYETIVFRLIGEDREQMLQELGLRKDLIYVTNDTLVRGAFPGERNPQGRATRFGMAFKKFGKQSKQYAIVTPQGRMGRRMYNIVNDDDNIVVATENYLHGSGGKTNG